MSSVLDKNRQTTMRRPRQPKTAAAFATSVQRALATGAHLEARQIADEGHRIYPDDELLGRMATVLAPPRILETGLPPDPSIEENHKWIKKNIGRYPEKWIALKGGKL